MTGNDDDVISLTAGDAAVSIHPPEGGRLGQITVGGRRLLRGREDGAHLGWGYWGSYPLLPWSNRIPSGRFEHGGRTHEVPVNWSDGTALHGLTAWEPWSVVSITETSVVEEIEAVEGPYVVTGRQRFGLSATHLDHELEVVNRASDAVPVGLGIHPWFKAGPIRVPADSFWPGATPLPDGPARPVTSGEDLRTSRVPPPMDRCYTGLTDTALDVPGIRLEWNGPVTQVVVYSEDPQWVCVEPVTMANDGFSLAARAIEGHGVIVLEPGESTSVSYRFVWTV